MLTWPVWYVCRSETVNMNQSESVNTGFLECFSFFPTMFSAKFTRNSDI